jgi:hypothetical protein
MFYFLKNDDQLLVESFTQRRTINGPRILFIPPLYRVHRRKGILLGPTDYVRIRNRITGEIRNEVGPQLYFRQADEEITDTLSAVTLKTGQYVRLLDKRTGTIRVEKGEASVYLSPTEVALSEVEDGVKIDDQTAVLIRDLNSGQLELITDPQVYIPAPNQEIVEVRERMRLEDHQTVVIKERSGRYIFRNGRDANRSFFLEPYNELISFMWSTGIHKDKRSLKITFLDSRPKFMWYEFEVRTQDNVELVIGVTFFWAIVDVEGMVRTTDDVPGDVCSHARSSIIQAVCQVTLESFLAAFNQVVRTAVIDDTDVFYRDRGVLLHAVEVRSIACKDPATQHILQEIIEETTNRLNRLQKQESENEIRLRSIQGEIEAEQMKEQLLSLQRQHSLTLAVTEGEAEAERVRAFLSGIGNDIAADDKIMIFNTLRKQDTLEVLSKGSAQLYFTPADIDLSIETKANHGNGK